MEDLLPRPLETLHWDPSLRSAPFLRSPAFLPLGIVSEDGSGGEWDADLPQFETLEEAIAATGAEAVVVEGPPHERIERVMQALALDLHVLAEAPLGHDAEDARRCVTIALNRGVRLVVAERAAYPDPDALAAAFARYVLEGVEPPTGGRRWLASQVSL